MRPLLGLSLLLLLGACSSSGGSHVRPLKNVSIQSTEPLQIGDERGRIGVTVRGEDTVLEIDKQTFICRGYAGYIGRFDIERGWLKIGKVEFGYDPENIWVRGRKSWNTVLRPGEQSWVVSQAGDIARSILRR